MAYHAALQLTRLMSCQFVCKSFSLFSRLIWVNAYLWFRQKKQNVIYYFILIMLSMCALFYGQSYKAYVKLLPVYFQFNVSNST